ncbi:pilus assembly protein [Saccharopolyspora sp. HNM0986]|uniref:TadE/TadG family type IV pilus assembly protein n=1 Tax=Saccharopolyspora galaxeae TaxID=2781241 RepID=UPI00190AAEC2|nr:TadE/TadG family type IV pilus assembly protein [Saccharopolyspora sp. HNM0986]MBK0870216.1 pilus assembly protein [Saccharopolyspora sp. HNM0986]
MSIPESEQGSASIELAVLTPVVLLVLALVIAGGRIVTANAALDTATTAAARAASLARTAGHAQTAARTVTDHALGEHGLHCTDQHLAVDTGGFATTPGHTGTVTVRTSCTVPLAELSLPGLPGSVALTSEFASPLDPYRERI